MHGDSPAPQIPEWNENDTSRFLEDTWDEVNDLFRPSYNNYSNNYGYYSYGGYSSYNYSSYGYNSEKTELIAKPASESSTFSITLGAAIGVAAATGVFCMRVKKTRKIVLDDDYHPVF